MWNTISNLGVTSVVEDIMCIKLLYVMEKKDKKGEGEEDCFKSVFMNPMSYNIRGGGFFKKGIE